MDETISKAEEKVAVDAAAPGAEEVMISPVMKPLVGGGAETDKWRVEEAAAAAAGAALSCAQIA